jgi:hypothetical protein
MIKKVKQHGKRGVERRFDAQPTKELMCKWRRQQGQVDFQYLYKNYIILIQILQNGLT